jgi:hypothetical protein
LNCFWRMSKDSFRKIHTFLALFYYVFTTQLLKFLTFFFIKCTISMVSYFCVFCLFQFFRTFYYVFYNAASHISHVWVKHVKKIEVSRLLLNSANISFNIYNKIYKLTYLCNLSNFLCTEGYVRQSVMKQEKLINNITGQNTTSASGDLQIYKHQWSFTIFLTNIKLNLLSCSVLFSLVNFLVYF